MNQEIGITFTATGSGKVIEKINAMADSVDKLVTKLGPMVEHINKAQGAFRSFYNSLGTAKSVFGEVRQEIGALNGMMDSMSRKAGNMTAQMNALNRASGGGVRGAGGGRAASQSGGFLGFLGGMGPMGFMMRFMAYHKLIQGGEWALAASMGSERKEMAAALGELSSVGFNAQQKNQVEDAAHQMAAKFVDVTATAYVNAMTQTASAFDVNKLGTGQLQRLNEAAINVGKLSKMSPDQAAELQSKMLNMYLASQPADVYRSLQGGGRANVRGFGNVNMADMGEKLMAMVGKSVEISNIWAPAIKDFMQYAGPVMAGRGWTPQGMLAVAATLSDLGFKGSKSGRAMKEVLVSAPQDYARMQLLAEGKLMEGATGEEKRLQDEMIKQRAALVMSQMGSAKDYAKFLKENIPAMRTAIATAKSQGLDLTKTLGFSKNFLPQIEALLKEGAVERLMEFIEKIGNATNADMLKKRQGQVEDNGMALQAFENAVKRWGEGFGKSIGTLGSVLRAVTNKINQASSEMEEKNRIESMTKKEKKWNFLNKDGEFTNTSLPERNVGEGSESALEYRERLNAWMKDQYEAKIAQIKKPLKGASAYEWEVYKGAITNAWKDVEFEGKAAWNKTWEDQDAVRGKAPKSWMEQHWEDMGKAVDQTVTNVKTGLTNFGEAAVNVGHKLNSAFQWLNNFIHTDPRHVAPSGGGVPAAKMSYEGDQSLHAQLASFSPDDGGGTQGQGAPSMRIFIGDREIRDIVVEAMQENHDSQRGSRMSGVMA